MAEFDWELNPEHVCRLNHIDFNYSINILNPEDYDSDRLSFAYLIYDDWQTQLWGFDKLRTLYVQQFDPTGVFELITAGAGGVKGLFWDFIGRFKPTLQNTIKNTGFLQYGLV